MVEPKRGIVSFATARPTQRNQSTNEYDHKAVRFKSPQAQQYSGDIRTWQ